MPNVWKFTQKGRLRQDRQCLVDPRIVIGYFRLDQARKELALQFDVRIKQLAELTRVRTTVLEAMPPTQTESVPQDPIFVLNARQDTIYAQEFPGFPCVIHIFNAQFMGVRAAAGNLPGSKLAVNAKRTPTPSDCAAIAEAVQKIGADAIVVHGYSEPLGLVAEFLSNVLGIPLFLVWHGNLGQLVYEEERRLFKKWVQLSRSQTVKRVHILKPNSSILVDKGYVPFLCNCTPKNEFRRPLPPFASPEQSRALIPSWLDVRKNWFSNLAAAIAASSITDITYYADVDPVFSTQKTIRRDLYNSTNHIQSLCLYDVVLNATLIDCHPMVDLESLSVGTPVVTSRLFIDGLDKHEYAVASTVDNVLDHTMIARVTDRLAIVPTEELDAMIADYVEVNNRFSFERYCDFLS